MCRRPPTVSQISSGPTPRAADGNPDFSGVWEYHVRRERPRQAKPEPGTAGANDIIPLSVRTSQFWNLGASFKDGLPFQPWAAELQPRVAENNKDNPDAHCLPIGLIQLDTHGQPRKMIQTPGCYRHHLRSERRHPADLY